MSQITFEIINPSDKYTIQAPDMEIAAVACVSLGQGKAAFDEIDGEREVPLFLFGGYDKWFTEQFGRDMAETFDRVLDERRDELADCLDSCLIGDAAHRASFNKGMALIESPEKREEWRQHWLDERRTSMNNIGSVAWETAANLRKANTSQEKSSE